MSNNVIHLNNEIRRRAIALREAAHAAMCIWTGCEVKNVEIHEEPDSTGWEGSCEHVAPDGWRDAARIALAGPAMAAICSNRTLLTVFMDEGDADFYNALDAIQEAMVPYTPEELAGHLPATLADMRGFVDAYICEGWRPAGIGRALQRKLSNFCKSYAEMLDYAVEVLHEEAASLVESIRESEMFTRCVCELSGKLVRSGSLSGDEVSEICSSAML